MKRYECRTRIADLRLAGASKLLFPRGHDLTAVSLNTSGGVTGGDRFRLRLHLEANTRACLTTQAAERLYRAQPGAPGLVANRVTLDAGARLHWLPQETILFDGAHVQRSFQAQLAATSELLAVEALVFGRTAMAEHLQDVQFGDRWTVRRAGELVFADRLRLDGGAQDKLQQHAGGAGAMATLLFISPRAEVCLDTLRAALPQTGGASLLQPGVLFARLFASDSFNLRKDLIPALEQISGAPLPRPWTI